MKQEQRSIDMIHGPLAGKIVRFSLPVIAGSVFQQVFNAADTAVVGRFASSQALAAVGGNASTISLLLNFFVGITSGAGVVTATLIGKQEEKDGITTGGRIVKAGSK